MYGICNAIPASNSEHDSNSAYVDNSISNSNSNNKLGGLHHNLDNTNHVSENDVEDVYIQLAADTWEVRIIGVNTCCFFKVSFLPSLT